MAVSIVMPKLGMVMSEGIISKWKKQAGDVVAEGDIVAEIETEKLNYDLEAIGSGIFHPLVSEGATVEVDGVVGYLLADGEAVPKVSAPTATTGTTIAQPVIAPVGTTAAQVVKPLVEGAPVRSTPGARRLAGKLGVDISLATPTGPGGRVVEDDVRTVAEQGAGSTTGDIVPAGLPESSESAPLTGMRKAVAGHMKSSLADTAQLSFFLELDVTEAQRLRKKYSSSNDLTLSMADVFLKASAETLERHPEHNTVLSNGNLLRFETVNIGFAVALKEGLIVPVVKGAGKKSIFDISVEVQELASKARDGKLASEEVSGGTFTISVLGSVDGFTPILNAGQSAILGIGRSVEKPVVVKHEIVVREMMTVSLTVDHQVIDGAVAASFLRRLQQMVERPSALFK